LHHLTVDSLNEDGDQTPGAYRSWQVEIAGSNHLPPDPIKVQSYMDELVGFINNGHDQKYDLLKIALAHHRFAWDSSFWEWKWACSAATHIQLTDKIWL
jgi:Fic family protein